MDLEKIAKELEGMQTLETISDMLKLKKTTCLNIISKLKKRGYLRRTGGGKQKRIYIISPRVLSHGKGMFDILNRYSKEKIIPPFIHVAHSRYSIEEAIVDLVVLNDIRININLLRLFNHVKDWNKLYLLSKIKRVCRNVGLLYDIARQATKTKTMPNNIYSRFLKSKFALKYKSESTSFKELSKKWRLKAPFNRKDLD